MVIAVLSVPSPGPAGGPGNPFIPSPPHDATQCACHTMAPAQTQGKTSPGGGNPLFPRDEYLTAICMNCHKTRCQHPVDVPAAPENAALPLGKEGTAAGKMLCTTCHEVHGGRLPPFLRVPGGPAAGGNRPLCDACHPAGKYMIHGKSLKDFAPECAVCHTERPDGPARIFLKSGFEKNCLLCHPGLPASCLLATEPHVPDVLSRQIGEVGLRHYRGRLTCGSCHRVMDAPDGRKLLRREYSAFRGKLVVKDIHRSGILCAPCHGTEVRRGERTPPLAGRDPEKACRVCHDNKLARADIHPSGIVPQTSEISVPRRFPLHEGRLVCTSCHDVCRPPKRDAEGAFLRGGPYRNREDVCFECHNAKGYMAFNPHRQIDESGKVSEKVCLYCHSSLPDRAHKGIGKEGYAGDPKTYCLGCHTDQRMHIHPYSVQHFGVRPSKGMWNRIKAFEQEHSVIFPLSPQGEVLCFSCHNPHQDKVLSGEAAVKSVYNRLRKSDKETYVVCNACHGGGGLK